MVHDSVHRSAARNQKLNDWVGHIGVATFAPHINLGIFRWAHIQHHRYTNGPADPDVWMHGKSDFEALGAEPFTYAAQSKTVRVASYYELPDEIADDPDELICWVMRASHAATAAKVRSARRPGSRTDRFE